MRWSDSLHLGWGTTVCGIDITMLPLGDLMNINDHVSYSDRCYPISFYWWKINSLFTTLNLLFNWNFVEKLNLDVFLRYAAVTKSMLRRKYSQLRKYTEQKFQCIVFLLLWKPNKINHVKGSENVIFLYLKPNSYFYLKNNKTMPR